MEHRAALVDYVAPIVGGRSQAEDVVQEAYIRFSASDTADRSGKAISNPVGYLYRIVRNLAIDWVRRSGADWRPAVEGELERVVSPVWSAEEELIHRDELRILTEALMELPERTRIAFNMHRIEGRPLREVADRLGISVVRAHQLVRQAVAHGARRLDEADYND